MMAARTEKNLKRQVAFRYPGFLGLGIESSRVAVLQRKQI